MENDDFSPFQMFFSYNNEKNHRFPWKMPSKIECNSTYLVPSIILIGKVKKPRIS
jgi:hypothetical protein